VPGVAGSSILGSGRVALILDTRTILHDLETEEAIR
jgi:chemotaxis protein histidine kinase CheA